MTLSNFVTLSLVEIEMQSFLFVTWLSSNATVVQCHLCHWWPILKSHRPIKFSDHSLEKGEIICILCFLWPCVTWSLENHIAFKFVAPYHKPQPVKHGRHRSLEIGDITFFICLVTWWVHVFNRLCDFEHNILSLEPASLSRLVGIDLVKVKI